MAGDANVLSNWAATLPPPPRPANGGGCFPRCSCMPACCIALNMWALGTRARRRTALRSPALCRPLSRRRGTRGIASINWQQDIVSVGASGAVFGDVWRAACSPAAAQDLLPLSIAKKLQASASVMIIYSLFSSMTKVGIDNAAHIGGLVAGVLIGRRW